MPSVRGFHAATLVVVAFAAPVCRTTPLGAQQTPAGAIAALPQRVRLRLPQARLSGLAVQVAGDSLLLQTTHSTPTGDVFGQRWVPLDCIRRAEVSVGRRSRWRGALQAGAYGLLVGAGAGVIVAKNKERGVKYPYSSHPIPATDNVRLMRNNVAQFGAGGLALGAIVGSQLPLERWRRVDPQTMLGTRADAADRELVPRDCRRTD